MATQQEFIEASEERIREWCRQTGAFIGEAAWVAIHSELGKMFEAGSIYSSGKIPKITVDNSQI